MVTQEKQLVIEEHNSMLTLEKHADSLNTCATKEYNIFTHLSKNLQPAEKWKGFGEHTTEKDGTSLA